MNTEEIKDTKNCQIYKVIRKWKEMIKCNRNRKG